jgi:hypothetical protein
MRAIRRVIINKPWNDVVAELRKQGYELSVMRLDGAILYPSKPLIDRMNRSKEN